MSSFGARDLAILLPDTIGDTQTFKTSEQLKEETETYEAPKPKVDASRKTRRYFPGKTPDWIPEEEGEITFTLDNHASSVSSSLAESKECAPEDRRLARLNQKNSSSNTGRRRQRYEAEIVTEEFSSSTAHETTADSRMLNGDSALLEQLRHQDEEEDVSARRARVKAKLLAAAREDEEKRAAAGMHPAKSDDEGSSEYETVTDSDASSSDHETDRVLLKPVFIPRSHRETIRDHEEKTEKAAAMREQNELLKMESRKHQTRVMVAESVRRLDEKQALDAQAVTDVDSDSGLPDDVDLTDDDDEEYASWKLRELKRIKNEAERREAIIREQLDVERRRNMTDEERREEDERLGKFREKEKKKWKYLQKYYHKGVFYMDEKSTGQLAGTSVLPSSTVENEESRKIVEKKLDARLRDYSGATLEDKYDREALPAVLQVKKFGMRGRTKYTHLVDQDTTKFGAEALGKDRNIRSNYLQKRSGVGDIDNAGRRKKKRDKL